MLRDIVAAEKSLGVSTFVSVTAAEEQDGGRLILAEVQVKREAGSRIRSELQYWRFTMVNEDGWRVCGAERLPDPSPSVTPPTAD